MDVIKQQYSRSVMSYITLSLISIIIVALLTIFISFWITELSDKDAQAINLSGSMRMKTYQIGLVLEKGDKEMTASLISELDSTWNHSLFATQRNAIAQEDMLDDLELRFKKAYDNWTYQLKPTLRQQLTQNTPFFDLSSLQRQVELTDSVVNRFQFEAENKIKRLRSFQLLALLSTICVGTLIFYLLKTRIETPLAELMDTVDRFGKGDYSQRATIEGQDELGLLGAIFNQMSKSIQEAYEELEQRVNKRTEELHQNNTVLEFLFSIAQRIIDVQQHKLDYQEIINDLSRVLKTSELDLCLFTTQGEQPYLHMSPLGKTSPQCAASACESCNGCAPFSELRFDENREHYPISRDGTRYGVISLSTSIFKPLAPWQEQLLRSTADQLAIALSLAEQENQDRRLAMLNERTVIARELHDSLAQALSYLQIQVTRLKRIHDMEKYELQPPVIEELREGLSSAYRQLRELLTTFRLKIDAGGLLGAMENTTRQLLERSDMEVELSYQLNDLPLSPMEEIHLLQIMREASQNAIHHSKGKKVSIGLRQLEDHRVELCIKDDGIGIKQSPEKLNHYGLAIMNERSRHLKGHIDISPGPESGTQVRFVFEPDYLREQEIENFSHEL